MAKAKHHATQLGSAARKAKASAKASAKKAAGTAAKKAAGSGTEATVDCTIKFPQGVKVHIGKVTKDHCRSIGRAMGGTPSW